MRESSPTIFGLALRKCKRGYVYLKVWLGPEIQLGSDKEQAGRLHHKSISLPR
jgi:hypothetical protein